VAGGASIDGGSDDRAGHQAVAKRVALQDGRALFEGLPVGEEVTFRAQDASTKLAGTTARVLRPGERATIDPLALPEPASLTVIPKLDARFQDQNTKAQIVGVAADPEKGERSDHRSAQFDPNAAEQRAQFHSLIPGTWHILAMLQLGGATQPVEVETVSLRPGEAKEIRPVIQPLVVSGHVLSHDRGVKGSIAFMDPATATFRIQRHVDTGEDGAFQALLPAAGVYGVSVRRSQPMTGDLDIGPMHFDESSHDVKIILPEGSLLVRVLAGGAPAEAIITATLLTDAGSEQGFAKLTRDGRTRADGQATLDDLEDGTWLVKARHRDGRTAEKSVAVSSRQAATVTLDLDGSSTFEGTVLDGTGTPAAVAAINCVSFGSDAIPHTLSGETDLVGHFSINLPSPAPERLQCGVTTVDGGIGAFVTAPGKDVQFVLPPSTGTVTVTNWTDRGNSDRFWLVSADGGLFDLTWAARKLRRLNAPFTIPKVPAGSWSVVRIDSPGAFDFLSRGRADVLPNVASMRVAPAKNVQISMGGGDTSVRP